MNLVYYPKRVCSRRLDIELEGEVIKDVKFTGGCDGNLKGISMLVKGKKVPEVIEQLRGITCGRKPTSCPDQLSAALEEAVKKGEK